MAAFKVINNFGRAVIFVKKRLRFKLSQLFSRFCSEISIRNFFQAKMLTPFLTRNVKVFEILCMIK